MASGAAASLHGQVRRQQVRLLRESPARHDRRHRRGRGVAGQLEALAPLQRRGSSTPGECRDQDAGEAERPRSGRRRARATSSFTTSSPRDRQRAGRHARRRARARGTRRTSSGRPALRESAPRKTAARCAPVATARKPDEDRHRARPARPLVPGRVARPAPRRPRPRPPHAPRKKGTSTDDSAKVAPSARASAIVAASPFSANAPPRRTMPSAARKSGIASVEPIEPNASGKAVQSITSTKISQTWFASHTGDIARLIIARTGAPRSAPPAVRSQNPAPKSAPPRTTYAAERRRASARPRAQEASVPTSNGAASRAGGASRRRSPASATYTTTSAANPTGMPPAPVTASSVLITS